MTGSFFSSFLVVGFLTVPLSTFATSVEVMDSVLIIQNKTEKREFKLSRLLKRKDVENLVVEKDPSYSGQGKKYKAVRVSRLFEGLKIDDDAVIQFKSSDGFSAPIAKDRLLNTSREASIAYIALENPSAPWAPIKEGKSSAGPFYLIWKNPELSKIGKEEWPSMLLSFEIKGNLESLYPQIFPQVATATPAVNKGFKVFTKNCFACHTMNKQGLSQMGPDLNLPLNPTEYLTDTALRRLIRNPQDVRHWPQGRMSSFPKNLISDSELDELIEYLKHMAQVRAG